MALSKVSVIWSCSYFGEIPHQGCWLSVKEQTQWCLHWGDSCTCARGGAFKNPSSSMEQDRQMIRSWHQTNICKSAVFIRDLKSHNSPRGSKGTHQWWSDRWSIFYPFANEKRVMGITHNPDDTQLKTQYHPNPHHVEDQCFVTLFVTTCLVFQGLAKASYSWYEG